MVGYISAPAAIEQCTLGFKAEKKKEALRLVPDCCGCRSPKRTAHEKKHTVLPYYAIESHLRDIVQSNLN